MTRLDPQDARQGKKGTPVLKVLVWALVLCAIVAIGLIFYARSMPDASISPNSGNASSSSASPTSNDATTTPTPATPAPAN